MERVSRNLVVVLSGLLVSALPCLLSARQAAAQASKPVRFPKEITFVMPYAPGGGGDVQLRIVARHLQKYLPGQPRMIVRNEPGAEGRAGVQRIYRSRPDGSFVGATYTPSALGTQAQYGVAGAGYDFTKFVLLTSTYHQPFTISVSPKTPYKNLADLKKAGKAISFCVTGGIDLAYVVIGAKTVGFPYRLIPGYRGAPLAIAAMLRGDCEAVSFGIELTNRYLKEGVRPVAVYAPERYKKWPQFSTSGEQGYPLDLQINLVFYLPPGSDPEMANVFRDALSKLYQDKEFLEAIRTAGFTPTFADTKQTQQIVDNLVGLFSKYTPELKEAAAKIR